MQVSKDTQDLFTAADVAKVRALLLKEQQGLCALSKLKVNLSDTHCDHAHDDLQLVRGALHRHANLTLGKVEGLWNRYLAHWYPHDLQTFLRQAADYLDKPVDTRWRHPGWIKKLKVLFNKLTAGQQNAVLEALGYSKGINPKQRKEIFAEAVLNRDLGYNAISTVLKKH